MARSAKSLDGKKEVTRRVPNFLGVQVYSLKNGLLIAEEAAGREGHASAVVKVRQRDQCSWELGPRNYHYWVG